MEKHARVTVEDVRRFSAAVDIRDARAFAAELQAFVHERVEAVELPATLDVETVEQTLARKAAALRASTRWAPGETDIQRGRAALLEAFDQPHNLPLPEFARLADKSRQQIYKDARRPGRAFARGCGDIRFDRRRGQGGVQRTGRTRTLRRGWREMPHKQVKTERDTLPPLPSTKRWCCRLRIGRCFSTHSSIRPNPIGASMMVVDATSERAAAFYEGHGFVRLPESPRLVLPMGVIRQLVESCWQ